MLTSLKGCFCCCFKLWRHFYQKRNFFWQLLPFLSPALSESIGLLSTQLYHNRGNIEMRKGEIFKAPLCIIIIHFKILLERNAITSFLCLSVISRVGYILVRCVNIPCAPCKHLSLSTSDRHCSIDSGLFIYFQLVASRKLF